MASLPTILLILAALGMGATVVAIIITFRSQREAQSAIFPIVREQEAVRAQRARLSIFVWIAVTALFLGGWLATLRLGPSVDTGEPVAANESQAEQPVEAASVVDETATPLPPTVEPTATTQIEPLQPVATDTDTPLPPPSSTSTPAPTETFTPVPSATFTATPQPTPTATSTPTPVPPTATPTATSTPVSTPTPIGGIPIVTSAPRTPAPQGAKMGPIQFAEDVTEDIDPVNPSDFFSDGIAAIYAIYPFSGMPKGVDFAVVWYKNGQEIARDEGEWQYGERAKSYSFLVPQGVGLYKLELYVNDTIMASDLFEVR